MPAAPQSSDTDELVEQASRGDQLARQQLLVRHRPRLRQMVAVRMDCRIAARVDPSDVVQEALGDAARHLDDYLKARPLPFYLWLRRLTWERSPAATRNEPNCFGSSSRQFEMMADLGRSIVQDASGAKSF